MEGRRSKERLTKRKDEEGKMMKKEGY